VADFIFGRDKEVAAWVAERIPYVTEFKDCSAIGINIGGNVRAGIVYHDYQPELRTMQISLASETPVWARPATIAALLHYPFVQLDVWALFSQMAAENEPAIRFNEKLGFSHRVVIGHLYGQGKHGVITRMLQPTFNARYGGSNGQKG